jgi:hypothetical protein
MVTAIRQTVTIQSGGTLEVRSPELRAGDRAEVIVLIEEKPGQASGLTLAALNELQASLKLTASEAAVWVEQAGNERKAFGRRL